MRGGGSLVGWLAGLGWFRGLAAGWLDGWIADDWALGGGGNAAGLEGGLRGWAILLILLFLLSSDLDLPAPAYSHFSKPGVTAVFSFLLGHRG